MGFFPAKWEAVDFRRQGGWQDKEGMFPSFFSLRVLFFLTVKETGHQ